MSNPITTNGTSTFVLEPGRRHTVFLAGSFGGASFDLALVDKQSGVSMALPDYSTLPAAAAFEFIAPCDQLTVTASTAGPFTSVTAVVKLCAL